MVDRFPDAVQRVSGAPLIRDRLKRGVVTIPGRQCSIALRSMLRCAREKFPASAKVR